MDDLYERLLATVAGFEASGYRTMPAALRAVLELHRPDPIDKCGGEPTHPHCSARGCGWVWPCDTVRAIARALDVPIGDQQ